MLQQFFDELHAQQRTTNPYVKDTKDSWVIEVDMPGVAKENVEVSVLGRSLEVKGERQKGEQKFLYKERFRLPDSLRNAEGVSATIELGVLTVRVPKQGNGVLTIPVS